MIEPATNFQASASIQGRRYEEIVANVLIASGWTITAKHDKVNGVEIDITATDPTGVEWWVECKGSWNGARPGSKRSDTVKKAIGNAWLLSISDTSKPYMLITSHLPDAGSATHDALQRALYHGLFTRIETTGALVPFAVDDDEDDS